MARSPQLTLSDIEVLYDLRFEDIYRFFYFKTLNKTEAEDLTSEVFLTFAEKTKKGEGIDNPKAYLFGISRNVFMKFLQRKYKQPVSLDSMPENFEEHIESTVEEHNSIDKVEKVALKFIHKLPQHQRAVIELRLIARLNLNEIAARLNKNLNYVKVTQHRAIQSIKRLIALDSTEKCTPAGTTNI